MRRARGAILLEVLLAFGLFVMAGLALFGAAREAGTYAGRAEQRAIADDLARSAIALVEAGVATPESLEGEIAGGPVDPEGRMSEGWTFSVEVTQDEGLLVELRVRAMFEGAALGDLRQVVPLRAARVAGGSS